MGNFSENLESVEYYEMAEKERLIGKQICIVGMLCADEDSLLGEWFFMDDLANWLKISEEELKRIIEGCNQFDDGEICLDAAKEFARIKKVDSYEAFQYFYITYGKTYLRLLLFLNKDKLEVWLKEIEDFDTPVIVLTVSNDRDKFISYGFSEHIEKVLDEEKIVKTFPKVIKKIKFETIEKQ